MPLEYDMEQFPIGDGRFIIITMQHFPDPYREFACSGCDHGGNNGCAFCNFSITAYITPDTTLINPEMVLTRIGAKEMREHYAKVRGRRDRIDYWQFMKEMERREA